MKSRRPDLLTVSERITRSKTSLNRAGNSLPIPVDLILEILSRLPAKSIARCRCVSKFWASILRLPGFTELFFTRSSARPQLLFTCQGHGELLLFSLPQLQNSDENSSIVVAANHLTRFSFDYDSSEICVPVCGLICCTHLRIVKGRKSTLPVICNPSTGQTLKLPKLKTRIDGVRSFLGYDPIGKQYKLLSMTWSYRNRNDDESMEYQVLTLGTKKLSWRKVVCSIPHYPGPKGICIDGSLYYAVGIPNVAIMILCFNVRSEEFKFIKRAEKMALWSDSTLVNYNGKLAALLQVGSRVEFSVVTGNCTLFELWVLEDPEKHEWTKHIHVLPPLWKTVVEECKLRFVGIIGMKEIVLSPQYVCDSGPFYIYYYNIEKKTIVRVEVRGMEILRYDGIRTFINHVENVELMQAFRT